MNAMKQMTAMSGVTRTNKTITALVRHAQKGGWSAEMVRQLAQHPIAIDGLQIRLDDYGRAARRGDARGQAASLVSLKEKMDIYLELWG